MDQVLIGINTTLCFTYIVLEMNFRISKKLLFSATLSLALDFKEICRDTSTTSTVVNFMFLPMTMTSLLLNIHLFV